MEEDLDLDMIELVEPVRATAQTIDNTSPTRSPIKMTLDLSTILQAREREQRGQALYKRVESKNRKVSQSPGKSSKSPAAAAFKHKVHASSISVN